MLTEMVLGSVATMLFQSLLDGTGKHSVANQEALVTERAKDLVVREAAKKILLERQRGQQNAGNVAGIRKENEMTGYDIIGSDVLGAIGAAQLIMNGDEDQLLNSLISGWVNGAGNTEIVGKAAGGPVTNAVQQALLQKVFAKGAGAVVQKDLNTRRRYPLGFVVTTIASAATANVPAAPQNLFRSERVIVPSNIAFDLGIQDIKVGNQSQLVQAQELPAAMFTEVSIDTGVTFDTAEVGNQVSMFIVNNGGDEIDFTAALLGTIAKA